MDDYKDSLRRKKLIEFSMASAKKISHQRALQHLKEGFDRRVLMLDATIRRIGEQVDKRGGPTLSSFIIPELAVFVNAFWMNICGALDNLSWVLNYELELVPTAVEDTGSERRQIRLFHRRFWPVLGEREPRLVKDLEAFAAWYSDLAALRDPGAHRIPIYPIPGVMDSETGAKATRLYAEAEQLMSAGKLDEGFDLIDRGYNLGTYQPLIALSHHGRTEVRDLVPELKRDEENFVSVSNIILHRLSQ